MRWIGAVLGLVVSSIASAGPFGLEMGAKLDDLKKAFTLVEKGAFRYEVKGVPQPHPAFSTYLILITPEHGLCKVAAYTPPVSTSAFGEQLKTKFDEVDEALTAKYGERNHFDHLKAGSIWTDARYWMIGLQKHERTLSSYWPTKGSQLPQEDLSAIGLEAHAMSQEAGMLSLGYEFANFAACIKTINGAQNSSL